MSAGRSSPSGPVEGLLTKTAYPGYVGTVTALTPTDPVVTLVSTSAIKAKQTYKLDVLGTVSSASATTTATVIARFTPTRTGVPVDIFTVNKTGVPTGGVALRFFSRFWTAGEAGTLALLLDNTGAQNLNASDIDAEIAELDIEA